MTKKPKYNDYPLEECRRVADRLARAGCSIYQKWTCGKCGERVTANLANHWTEQGHHEERADDKPCGFVTDLRKTGCNYLATADTEEAVAALNRHMRI